MYWALFFIIFLEGYVVLATELLAIRQTIPYVGSGTDTVSIVIAAVLMPLAVGYYAGGLYRPYTSNGIRQTVRRKLVRNIILAAAFLLPGLSALTINIFFGSLLSNGYTHRLLLSSAYVLLFLVTPVFLLGQTVPLVSNYFSKEKLPHVTGRVLFFSTVGSFFGAVFSTLFLMSFLGVHITVIVNFLLMFLLVILLEKSFRSPAVHQMGVILVLAVIFNSGWSMRAMGIVENNQYNTVRILSDNKGNRYFSLNNNNDSRLGPDGRHDYVEFISDGFIKPLLRVQTEPVSILVIGAGGFTMGIEDDKNRYVFIDIDDSLKDMAEKYFLGQKLGANKEFVPLPARAFLAQNKELFDMIILDAYQGDITLPEHLVTREFFRDVRKALAPGGLMVANFIASPTFDSAFSRNLDTTLRSVFPYISRQVIPPLNGWDDRDIAVANIIYFSRNSTKNTERIYKDNLNRIFFDKPQRKPTVPRE